MKYLNMFVALTVIIGSFVGYYSFKELELRVQILENENQYQEILK